MPNIILIVGKLVIFLGVKAWCMIFASSVLGKGAKNMTLNIHKFLVLSQALKDYGMNKQLHIRIMYKGSIRQNALFEMRCLKRMH